MSTLSAAVLLFLVMDPLGNIVCFICALKSVDPSRHRKIIVRELLIALGILTVFLFSGKHLLEVMHISESSLGIAGGIILFLIALKMIFGATEEVMGKTGDGEPLVVPLAVPFVAGPSAMATVILLMAHDPGRWIDWLIALVGAWSVSGVILLFSSRLRRVLGTRGLTAIERLMGMLLTAVSVEMLITGVRRAFIQG